MPIRGEYVGAMPEEEGNYLCFDLLNNDQWITKLFRDGEGNQKVLCGRTNEIHDPEEHDQPNVRWMRITPLTRAELERYLAIPA